MDERKWYKAAAVIVCIFAAVVAVLFLFRRLFGVLLPFVIAYLAALAVTPGARFISEKTKIPRKICSVVLLMILLALLGGLITLGVERLFYELERLFSELMEEGDRLDGISGEITQKLDEIFERIPLLGRIFGTDEVEEFRARILEIMRTVVGNLLGRLGGWLPSAVIGLISDFPSILLATVVTILACFYFAVDIDAVREAILSVLPTRARGYLEHLRGVMSGVLVKWARAYFLIFLLTFGELLLGFVILRVDYSLLVALLGALIDILPVFGTGLILLPWGLYCLISGNISRGIGLFVMYGAITIIRQLAEPHIVGGSFGLHPLLTLGAMYCGFKLFGVVGMIIFPAVLVVIGGLSKKETKSV